MVDNNVCILYCLMYIFIIGDDRHGDKGFTNVLSQAAFLMGGGGGGIGHLNVLTI